MELIPSWEANSRTDTHFPADGSLRVQKSLPLVPILSQLNPVQTTPSYLSKILHNIIFLWLQGHTAV
jgi:hypothetical protein